MPITSTFKIFLTTGSSVTITTYSPEACKRVRTSLGYLAFDNFFARSFRGEENIKICVDHEAVPNICLLRSAMVGYSEEESQEEENV